MEDRIEEQGVACPVCAPELFDATRATVPVPMLCVVHEDHLLAALIREKGELDR